MVGKTRASDNQSSGKPAGKLFDWDGGQAGALVGAAVAGAAVGLVANYGRKFLVQSMTSAAGDWFDALKAEHDLTLAVFDKIQETDETQTGLRSALLAKLKFALSKHAIEEEMVIYPALRQANQIDAADELNSDHGYVKTYLYELETTAGDDPQWIARINDFRVMIEEHMREEENSIFPALRASLSDEQNKKLTAMMNKEGFLFA